jgi:cytochrome c oxidase assembly protein subunit 15
MLGALTRHTGGGLAIPDYPLSYGRIIPPYFSTQVLYHFAHRVGGLLVLLFAVWLLIKVYRISRSNGSLRFPAAFLLVSLLLQIVLGGVTIWSRKEPILTSLHVVCGALVLAVCVWLTMNAFRTLRPHSARQQIEATAI